MKKSSPFIHQHTFVQFCKSSFDRYCVAIIPSFEWGASCLILFTALVLFPVYKVFSQPDNKIKTENQLSGSPSSEWDVVGAGDLSIQGFATDISVNKSAVGQTRTVYFKIKTPASAYVIDIFRLGYYQGNGARKVASSSGPGASVIITASLPQTQPTPIYEAATGLTDCGNWTVSAHWDIPTTAVSGIYLAKLTRLDNNGASHIVFIVRDDATPSGLLFKTADATWQAYNNYGGNSLYVNNSGTAIPGFNHATKVSYNRPFYTRSGGGGGGASEDWLFNAEYPMVRFLEKNGYDISYTTDIDLDRGAAVTPARHKVIVSVGHDEYWSANERNKVEAARNSGVHLAFFSGNEVYWKTRWENSTDASNTSYRTLVCYKEGSQGEDACGSKCDPMPGVWTGLWRTGCPEITDACKPENALTGQISWEGTTAAIKVPAAFRNLRFWRNTTIAGMADGQTIVFPNGTLGYEWDWEQPAHAASYPKGRILLSSTTETGKTHKLSLYKHSSGALVFGAGTVQWSWGLDGVHDRGIDAPSTDMQQATVNLFADMGVQPTSLQTSLVVAAASSDVVAPISTISFPTQGTSIQKNVPINITGSSSDAGGVVAGGEISVDGGVNWIPVQGTTNWSFAFTPATVGLLNILSRGFDDSGNMEGTGTAPASNAVNVTVTESSAACPCSIFLPSITPANVQANDGQAIEVGVKFQSNTNGFITGIRFYKALNDNGIHVGHLWSGSGTSLAVATFTNESNSGWQQINFSNPVAVTANTTYVASYHSSANKYTFTQNFFNIAIENGPVKALADGESGPNGVYGYTATPAFPTSSFNKSNYWVDVVFNNTGGPDLTPPSIVSKSPAENASGVSVGGAVVVTFNEAIQVSTINSGTIYLRGANNLQVPATVTYNTSNFTATISPAATLNYSSVYTVTIKGGNTDPRIKDEAGNALAADVLWSFTTANPPPPPPTEGPGGPILLISAALNPFSRYPVEILRAEGLNQFNAMDVSLMNPGVLNNYDVVIVGDIQLSTANVTMLSDWVTAGGTLIAFKPDVKLATLLGLTPAAGSLTDKYIKVNTASGPGVGIVSQSIQFHGTANYYTLNGATSIAALYSDASTPTSYPAISSNSVGTNGGKAIAFTYDLARSIVYTRQGNPAWAGQKRDGSIPPIRSDDMFFPDWVDFSKIAIPQADEQQRLLANLIIKGNLGKKPLPRFWYLPRKLKAAVVMTGDDHGNNGTTGRFNQYLSLSTSNTAQAVADWTAIRGTSYVYPGTMSLAQAQVFETQGFEIALHVNTNCDNYTATSLNGALASQLATFNATTGVAFPKTSRTHCVAWSDWASKPKVEVQNGIRLNTDYYYWPASWVLDRPGMFTGSGMPMRFADLDGTLIDNYQLTTQLTDESGINYPNHINQLLDRATGSEGYYGVFCANMHTDANGGNSSQGSDAIIAAAQARQVPVISAKQMLTWLDGRNGSSFGSITYSNGILNFNISIATGANKLQAMLPVQAENRTLSGITFNSAPVNFTTELIKGISYAFFDASAGNYAATYQLNAAPLITSVIATPNSNGTATITWATDAPADSRVDYGTVAASLNLNKTSAGLANNHSLNLTNLVAGTTYYFRATSSNANGSSTLPVLNEPPASFATAIPCPADFTLADFSLGTPGTSTALVMETNGEVILKPTRSEDFTETTLPSGWGEATWEPGGTTTYNAGSITVNGTHVYALSASAPGASLEFVATFSSGNFQNIGFTGDAAFNNPWVVIGRGNIGADNNLYARVSDGQTAVLGSDLLNTPHRYRIQWKPSTNNFEFYVDGNLIATPSIIQTVGGNMVAHISDFPASGGGVTVDWIRASPYATSGSYTSRIFDGAETKAWGAATWNATLPVGTSLSVFVRKGDAPVPDAGWTSFGQVGASGGIVGGQSRYVQYRLDLATTINNVTAVVKDVAIACTVPAPDITPPLISNIVATPAADGFSANITWTSDEPSNSTVNYGTDPTMLTGTVTSSSLVTGHSLQLTGLVPGAIYYFRVKSDDAVLNSATAPNPPAAPLNFTTVSPPCFEDITFAEFNGGVTGSSTYVSNFSNGEVILKPAVGAEFDVLPSLSEWASFNWGTGGTSAVSSGVLSVNGAKYNTQPQGTAFGPGTTLEFEATFGSSAFQHIGFGGGTDGVGTGGIYNGESPWAMFSTNNVSGSLFARTFLPGGASATELIPGSSNLIGSSHKYRIEWKLDGSFDYYVDNVLVRAEPIAIIETMRPAISDFNSAAPAILVDWIHVNKYPSAGSFTSRIYDGGSLRLWNGVTWAADVPGGTNMIIEQRQGNTSIPDASWTAYSPIPSNGAIIGSVSRYIQYRAMLSTTLADQSPVLKDIHFTCINPASITGKVELEGRPAAPNAQWQVPVQVDIYNTNGQTLLYSFNITTDQSGQFIINGVVPGTYKIAVKNSHTLRRVMLNQQLIPGNTNINFGILREGDANNDNRVSLLDLSILVNTFNKFPANAGYDSRADFNHSGSVSLPDFSLLLNNFNLAGENP